MSGPQWIRRAPRTMCRMMKWRCAGKAKALHESSVSTSGPCRYRRDRTLSQEAKPIGARNVLQSIRSAIRFIAENPRAAQETDSPGVRVKVVVDYPYKIFYSALY